MRGVVSADTTWPRLSVVDVLEPELVAIVDKLGPVTCAVIKLLLELVTVDAVVAAEDVVDSQNETLELELTVAANGSAPEARPTLPLI